MSLRYYIAVFVSFIILSFILYGNTIQGNFVHDDNFFAGRSELREQEHLLKVWNEPYLPYNITSGLFRPLTVFSFNLNFVLFGQSPVSFHIVNIFLNGMVVFLIFYLSQKLFKNTLLALFIAVFYAFLPIHTEAVANIKSRDEILSALFVILSWIVFISATEFGKKIEYIRIFFSAFIFLLAVLSKELIIVLPFLFLVTFIFRKKPSLEHIIKISIIFTVTACLYMLWRYLVLGRYAFGNDILYFAINPLVDSPFWIRIFTAFKIAFIYIGKTFVPWNLSASYHYNQLTLVDNLLKSWQSLAGLGLLIVLFALVVYKKTRTSIIGLGALTFLCSYWVISKIIFRGGDLLAERWMYFPSVGLSFIGGFLVYFIFRRKRWLGIIVFTVTLLFYIWVLIPRNTVWLTDERLFKSITETAPNSVMGYWGLAHFYSGNNQLELAKKYSRLGFAIDPDFPPLLNTIGKIAYEEKNFSLAETAFLKLIEVAPDISIGYQNAVRVYLKTGQKQKANELLKYLNEEEKKEVVGSF